MNKPITKLGYKKNKEGWESKMNGEINKGNTFEDIYFQKEIKSLNAHILTLVD